MTVAPADASPSLRRQERFASVASTNDVVRGWLAAGEPEICVAVADEQTAGRGRSGRRWTSPAGAGLLVSLGFRPSWLSADQLWRLAAVASLAMAEAAEDVVGLAHGTVQLKWPNDLVVTGDPTGPAVHDSGIETSGWSLRKLGGVLGETDGLGSSDVTAIVGIGVNANWRSSDFPEDLAPSMTSLQAANGDRPVDAGLLLTGFLARLENAVARLHSGRFDAAGWADRQVTTGHEIEVAMPDGTDVRVFARGVDAVTGALRVGDPATGTSERFLLVGEIRHVRLVAV